MRDAMRGLSLTDTPRGPFRFDQLRQRVGPVFIRKCERKDGRLVNTTLKTYPDVSQFWTYDEKDFLWQSRSTRATPRRRRIWSRRGRRPHVARSPAISSATSSRIFGPCVRISANSASPMRSRSPDRKLGHSRACAHQSLHARPVVDPQVDQAEIVEPRRIGHQVDVGERRAARPRSTARPRPASPPAARTRARRRRCRAARTANARRARRST